MKNFILKHGKEILTLLFGIGVWLFWSNLYWGHLLYQELLQMFLFDADYWHERVAVAGGFADYVADSGAAIPAEAWVILAVGCAVAFAVSLAAIKFLMGYIKKRDFTAFGYYRIILGIILIIYFFVFVR